MGGVGTSIIRNLDPTRPRPRAGHYTLNCEEPEIPTVQLPELQAPAEGTADSD